MSEKFLNNPNIPDNKVTTVFADVDDIALKSVFNELYIKVVNVAENPFLDSAICKHADILGIFVGKSTFLVDKYQVELCNFIENNGGKTVIIDKIKSPYPNDCLLNFADIGDYIICNRSILIEEIKEYLPEKEIIDVKQGYSKCSVCICKRNTIITDDISIYNAVSQYENINSLLVEKGSVQLKNYNYGFIGGCCGLVDKNTLLFNGDLSTHSDFDKIRNFLYYNDVKYIAKLAKLQFNDEETYQLFVQYHSYRYHHPRFHR